MRKRARTHGIQDPDTAALKSGLALHAVRDALTSQQHETYLDR
jgi:hypothetical protein